MQHHPGWTPLSKPLTEALVPLGEQNLGAEDSSHGVAPVLTGT